jgi:hypothetical protein
MYAEVMNAEVLAPLGMTSTVLDIDIARKREHATPHSRTLTFEAVPLATETERGVDSVMPAGGAWSTVRDLSRWLMMELADGKLQGKQIVSEANLLERRKPRVRISAKQSYGLALFIDESRGLRAIGHGGNTFGFIADATFFPEHDLAFIMLTNVQAANAYLAAVRRRLIELLWDADQEAERNFAFGIKQQGESIRPVICRAGHRQVDESPPRRHRDPPRRRRLHPRRGRVEDHNRRAQGSVGNTQDRHHRSAVRRSDVLAAAGGRQGHAAVGNRPAEVRVRTPYEVTLESSNPLRYSRVRNLSAFLLLTKVSVLPSNTNDSPTR